MTGGSGKDPITCHVLDTTIGRPAKGIRVRLEGGATSATDTPKTFDSVTDNDGRILAWLPFISEHAAGEVPVYTLVDVLSQIEGPSRWTLRFDTAAYFGEDKTFFPEVTVTFRVEAGQTYHVPLLLNPFSYTTYRGS
ncbi:hypothetical protein BGZ63DRAFT_384277 [Mariannaea sp. PMI_226]|nr:hypothetical protein BGZ63DRAFT_384277 [Mariannaea sp. PMI_226]